MDSERGRRLIPVRWISHPIVLALLLTSACIAQLKPTSRDSSKSTSERNSPRVSAGISNPKNRIPEENAERNEAERDEVRVIIYPREGRTLYGTYLRFSSDTLVFSSSGTVMKFTIADVASVLVFRPGSSSLILELVPLGIYTGIFAAQNVLSDNSDASESNEAGFYLQKPGNESWPYFAMATLGGLAFGGLGALIGEEEQEEEFNFEGSDEERASLWESLKEELEIVDRPKRITLSFQAAHVFTRLSSIDDQAVDYSPYQSTSFTILRSVRMSYEIAESFEAGAAIVFFGEPVISSEPYVYERFAATGYFLEGTFRPFPESLPEWLYWKIALGAGIASIEYSASSGDSSGQPIEESAFDGSTFGLGISTALDFSLTPLLSIGLVGDYVVAPGKKMIAIPQCDLRERTMGNGSIGFSLGYHF
jgi:hypothetical protein